MKKFKTCKEILINPMFKELSIELLREEVIRCEEDTYKEEDLKLRIDNFIERKIKQCKMEGI